MQIQIQSQSLRKPSAPRLNDLKDGDNLLMVPVMYLRNDYEDRFGSI